MNTHTYEYLALRCHDGAGDQLSELPATSSWTPNYMSTNSDKKQWNFYEHIIYLDNNDYFIQKLLLSIVSPQ